MAKIATAAAAAATVPYLQWNYHCIIHNLKSHIAHDLTCTGCRILSSVCAPGGGSACDSYAPVSRGGEK